jgi:hypothetical protein
VAAAESSQIANRVATIKADRDFLARQAALDRVEKASPAVKKYVEFFLAFLIAIDLVALMLKLTHLFSTGGAYERARPRCGRTSSSTCTASRSAPPSSPGASRSSRGPSRRPTSSGFAWRVVTRAALESDELRLHERPAAVPSLGGPAPARRSATDDGLAPLRGERDSRTPGCANALDRCPEARTRRRFGAPCDCGSSRTSGAGGSGGLSRSQGGRTEIWYSVWSPASTSPHLLERSLTSQPWAMTWPATGRTYRVITLDVPSRIVHERLVPGWNPSA